MTVNYLKAAMLCALALAALAAAAPSAADEFVIESDSEGIIDNFHYSRSKRSEQWYIMQHLVQIFGYACAVGLIPYRAH